jgi:hypothetical protein
MRWIAILLCASLSACSNDAPQEPTTDDGQGGAGAAESLSTGGHRDAGQDGTAKGGGGAAGKTSADATTSDVVVGVDVGTGAASIKLAWDAPTKNDDGTPLTDLASYRVYYNLGAQLTKVSASRVDVPTLTTTFLLSGVAPGNYTFVVTAVDSSGNESADSASFTTEVQ